THDDRRRRRRRHERDVRSPRVRARDAEPHAELEEPTVEAGEEHGADDVVGRSTRRDATRRRELESHEHGTSAAVADETRSVAENAGRAQGAAERGVEAELDVSASARRCAAAPGPPLEDAVGEVTDLDDFVESESDADAKAVDGHDAGHDAAVVLEDA